MVAPSTAVASNGTYDTIAVYENDARGDGAAVWMSQYYMMDSAGLTDYDNLQYLENVFA